MVGTEGSYVVTTSGVNSFVVGLHEGLDGGLASLAELSPVVVHTAMNLHVGGRVGAEGLTIGLAGFKWVGVFLRKSAGHKKGEEKKIGRAHV